MYLSVHVPRPPRHVPPALGCAGSLLRCHRIAAPYRLCLCLAALAGVQRKHGVRWEATGLDPARHAFGVRSTSGVHNAMAAIIDPTIDAVDGPTSRVVPKVGAPRCCERAAVMRKELQRCWGGSNAGCKPTAAR